KGPIDLGPTFDHLEADGRRLAGATGEARPRLDQGLADLPELLEFGALLVGDHLEDVVQGPCGIAARSVEGHLDEAASLEALQRAVGLDPVHAAHAGPLAGGAGAGPGPNH